MPKRDYRLTVSGIVTFDLPHEQANVDCLSGNVDKEHMVELALDELAENGSDHTVKLEPLFIR
jgi:hypothetical protein